MGNRSNTFNPNNRAFRAARINRGNQLNPSHSAYHSSRANANSFVHVSFGSKSGRFRDTVTIDDIFQGKKTADRIFALHGNSLISYPSFIQF